MAVDESEYSIGVSRSLVGVGEVTFNVYNRGMDDHDLAVVDANGVVRVVSVPSRETRTLVESDQSNQYTLPRFYKDQVIYTKSRQLWSIDVNGSNNFKLFEVPMDTSKAEK